MADDDPIRDEIAVAPGASINVAGSTRFDADGQGKIGTLTVMFIPDVSVNVIS